MLHPHRRGVHESLKWDVTCAIIPLQLARIATDIASQSPSPHLSRSTECLDSLDLLQMAPKKSHQLQAKNMLQLVDSRVPRVPKCPQGPQSLPGFDTIDLELSGFFWQRKGSKTTRLIEMKSAKIRMPLRFTMPSWVNDDQWISGFLPKNKKQLEIQQPARGEKCHDVDTCSS